jgi:hypothetical protein
MKPLPQGAIRDSQIIIASGGAAVSIAANGNTTGTALDLTQYQGIPQAAICVSLGGSPSVMPEVVYTYGDATTSFKKTVAATVMPMDLDPFYPPYGSTTTNVTVYNLDSSATVTALAKALVQLLGIF